MCVFFFRRVSSVSQMSVWEINCYLFYFCLFPPGKNFKLVANFLKRHINLRCVARQLYGGMWRLHFSIKLLCDWKKTQIKGKLNIWINHKETSSWLGPGRISHSRSKSSVVDMLMFLPLTYFYVLSLPALGVVERRPPLSGSAERPVRVGERRSRAQLRIYLYGSSSACDPWPPFHGTDMALFLSVKLISAPRGRGCWGNHWPAADREGAFSQQVRRTSN